MQRIVRIGFLVLLEFTQFNALSISDPPIYFIENVNQWSCDVDFMAHVSGGDLLIEAGRFRYHFLDTKKLEQLHGAGHTSFNEGQTKDRTANEIIDGRLIEVNFLGSNKLCKVSSFGSLPFYFNYFLGTDESMWASKAKAFSGALYHSVYDSIDLKIYAQGDEVKYDWILKPSANPALIKAQYLGSELIHIEDDKLYIETPVVKITEMKPIAYQWIDGQKRFVSCNYVLFDNVVSFEFPEGYDPCYELIIDPLLIFSTYSGSTADNWGSTATPGERAMLYSSGVTTHINAGGSFPATPGAFQTSYGGLYDIAVLKYDSTGNNLLYASYLGGDESESPHSLVMNSDEELIILGTTSSLNFPTTAGAIDRTFNGGHLEANVITYTNGSDIFVSKISKDGSRLIASTYLGGSDNDGLNPSDGVLVKNYGDQLRGDVITDKQGNILVSTVSSSSNFPVANSFDIDYDGGDTDGLLLKLSSDLTHLKWGAFIGGSGSDASHTIKLDEQNTIYVGGGTASMDFPVTVGSYQTVNKGNADGWIAKIAEDGSSILSSTLTGTNSFDQVYFLDLNKYGEVYVYGQTAGPFPVTAGTYGNANSGQFIQKFSNDLSKIIFSTVFGSGRGIPDISPTAFLVNDCNNLYMAGWGGDVNNKTGHWNSDTFGMPVSSDAYQKTTSGSDFYFIVLTEDASQFLYGTYLGGTESRTHVDGGTSRLDKSGVIYHAVCSGCAAFNATNLPTSDFPTTSSAWSTMNQSGNCNNAAFKFDLSSLKARIRTNDVALAQPGYNMICPGDTIVFENFSIGGETYLWDFGDGKTEIKTVKKNIAHHYDVAGKYKIKLKAIDGGTCIGKDSTYTMIEVHKPLGFASKDQTICFGAAAQLVAEGGVKYEWSSEDEQIKSQLATLTVRSNKNSTLFVSITDKHTCLIKDTVFITVVPNIDLKYAWKKTYSDCAARPVFEIQNLTDPTEEVFFDFGDGTSSELDHVFHEYDKDGNYFIKIKGRKDFCIYEKGEEIPIYSVKAPNVITPEQSPGKNDTFKVFLDDQPISIVGIKTSLIVYNRWGEEVFSNDNYDDSWSAENLNAGIYYYELKIDQEELSCKNWLHVIK